MFHRSVTNLSSQKKHVIKKFFNSFDNIVTDCDGVLWIFDVCIEESAEVLNRFREMGKKIFYVTNDSSESRERVAVKCKKFHHICTQEEIVTSAYLAAQFLKTLKFKNKVFIIGHSGIAAELDLVGIKHTGVGIDVFQKDLRTLTQNIHLDPKVGAVVVGYDEHISFPKILKAATYLRNQDCIFIGTNTDPRRRAQDPRLSVPGCGSFLAAIQACSGRIPTIMGKPSLVVSNYFLKHLKLEPKRTLMIGDSCSTDIAFGIQCNFQTMLVLTGVTDLSELKELKKTSVSKQSEWIPDVYLHRLGDLKQLLD